VPITATRSGFLFRRRDAGNQTYFGGKGKDDVERYRIGECCHDVRSRDEVVEEG
jgi:hypothetical protein